MTTSQAPDPSVEQSLAAIAREMQLVNNQLAMITGWMSGQEIITENLSRTSTELARAYGQLTSQVAQNSTHVDNALNAVGMLTQAFGGLKELAESTFDIVAELKKRLGGEDGEASAKQKAAQQ